MRQMLLVAIVTAVASQNGVPASFTPSDVPVPALDRALPGSGLPVLKERRYTMSGAARPLLFWIGRDDIGLARIVWRRGPDGARGYELLVGTDPARAPRGINRWGFISEEAAGAGGSVLALMTGSHDTSYEHEAASAQQGPGSGDFRTIRTRMQDGRAVWELTRVRTPQALTVHQVAAALEYLRNGGSGAERRQKIVAGSVRPGFLVAVADLVEQTVQNAQRNRGAVRPAAAVEYVFGEQTYELRVRDIDSVRVTHAGQQIDALKTSFQTRAHQTGARSQFALTIGTSGDVAGVPLAIEWQPRWWLKVRLNLEAPSPAR